jgi:antitoxin VapB
MPANKPPRPKPPRSRQPLDVETWRAALAAAGADEFLPEGLPEDKPLAPDGDISFD